MLTSVRGLLAATLLAGTALAATPALADDTDAPSEFTVSGGATFVTDYRFRGISQTLGDPAIQGTIGLSHSSGFYVGAWGSNIDFGGCTATTCWGSMELDLYGGWSGEVASGTTVDVGLLYYAYPGGHLGKTEFFEPYASISHEFGPAALKVGLAYAWKQDALGGNDNIYLYSNLDVAIPDTPLTLSGHVGYTDGALDFSSGDGSAWDWSIGASATVLKNVTLGVSFVGTEGPNVKDISDNKVVGSISVSF